MRANRFITGILGVSALLASCASTQPLDPFGSSLKAWPEPPDTQSIDLVGEFRRDAVLGIRRRMWGRLIVFAAGSRDDAMVRPMGVAASDDKQSIFVAEPGAH